MSEQHTALFQSARYAWRDLQEGLADWLPRRLAWKTFDKDYIDILLKQRNYDSIKHQNESGHIDRCPKRRHDIALHETWTFFLPTQARASRCSKFCILFVFSEYSTHHNSRDGTSNMQHAWVGLGRLRAVIQWESKNCCRSGWRSPHIVKRTDIGSGKMFCNCNYVALQSVKHGWKQLKVIDN